jgi:hypothetical protein
MQTKDSGLNRDLEEDCELLDPNQNYMGKSFSEWIAEYTNWLIQPNPDLNNNGEVVFLRGLDFHDLNEKTATKGVGPAFQDIEPVAMVGKDSIYIPVKKPILFPIVMAIGESIDTKLDDNNACRMNYVRSIFDGYSANSNQVKVDGKNLMSDDSKMNNYHIESSEFTLNVPDVPYGSSLKDVIKMPLRTPGKRSCVVSGIFFMLKFLKRSPNSHILRFYSNSCKTMLCDTDGLYYIKVLDTEGEVMSSRHDKILSYKLMKKLKTGEITDYEHKSLMEQGNISPDEPRHIKTQSTLKKDR